MSDGGTDDMPTTAIQKRESFESSMLPSTLQLTSLVQEFTLTPSSELHEKRALNATQQSSLIEGVKGGQFNATGFFYDIQDIAFQKNYLFIASGYDGLKITDVNNANKTSLIGYYNPLTEGSYAFKVKISGDYVFIANDYGGLLIINISDVKNPSLVSSYSSGLVPIRNLAILNNKAYIFEINSGQFDVINITDLHNPIRIHSGNINYLGAEGITDIAQSTNNLFFISPGLGVILIDSNTFSDAPAQGNIKLTQYASAIRYSKNILYVATKNIGLNIIDVNNPTLPKLLGTYGAVDATDVEVVGNVAYLTAGTGGLKIIDVNNPSMPFLLGEYSISNAASVSISGDYAYLIFPDSIELNIINISTPSSPTLLETYYFPLDEVIDISVVGDVVYIASPSQGFGGFNVKNLQNIWFVGATYNALFGGDQIARISISGVIACMTDLGGMQVIGLGNQLNPVFLGRYTIDSPGFDVFFTGNLAFLAAGGAGLHVIDLSSPGNPILLGIYGVPNGAYTVSAVNNIAYVGDSIGNINIVNTQLWTSRVPMLGAPVKIAAVNNYAYVADIQNIVHVIDFNNPLIPKEISTYLLSNGATHMEVAGDFLYVAEGEFGVEVIDMSNPFLPQPAGKINAGISNAHTLAIANNQFLYVDDIDANTLIIFNIPEKLVIVNNQLAINQGQTVNITLDDMSARDTRQVGFYPAIAFSVSNVTNGQFIFLNNSNQAITEFTQQDIINQQVQFTHSGGQVAPSYLLSAIFGNSSTSPTPPMPANISFSKVYQTPTLGNNQFTVELDGMITLNATNINASVSNGDYASLLFTVNNIGNGRFQNTSNSGIFITQFTQQQIIDGEIQFVHFGNATDKPSYQISVADGPLSNGTFEGTTNLIVPPSPLPPKMTNNQITINQDEVLTLTPMNLNATSTNVKNSSLILFTVDEIGNGRFQLTSNPGISITQFTQAQINNGWVQFVQLGSSTDQPSYQVSVSDGQLSTPFVNGTIDFKVHQMPVLGNNQVIINQDETITLTPMNINASSSSVEVSLLQFIVNNIGNARFQLSSNPGVFITQFSQEQIVNGSIQLAHLGGGSDIPSYEVSVSDGQLATPFSRGGIDFDAAPQILVNRLNISNGETVIISSEDLQATDIDSNKGLLVFDMSNIVHGVFRTLKNGTNSTLNSFVQQDMIDNFIQFTHDGSGIAPSYVVSVSDGRITIANQTPTILFMSPMMKLMPQATTRRTS